MLVSSRSPHTFCSTPTPGVVIFLVARWKRFKRFLIVKSAPICTNCTPNCRWKWRLFVFYAAIDKKRLEVHEKRAWKFYFVCSHTHSNTHKRTHTQTEGDKRSDGLAVALAHIKSSLVYWKKERTKRKTRGKISVSLNEKKKKRREPPGSWSSCSSSSSNSTSSSSLSGRRCTTLFTFPRIRSQPLSLSIDTGN